MYRSSILLLAVVVAVISATSETSVKETAILKTSQDSVPHDIERAKDHQEAAEAIQVLVQEGKNDSACRNLASSSIKEITDNIRNTQKLINKTPDGSRCKHAGQEAVVAAQRHESRAKTSKFEAITRWNKAKNVRVSVRAMRLTDFTRSCDAFLTSYEYVAAKKVLAHAANKAREAKGFFDDAQKATRIAKAAARKQRDACLCRTKAAHAAARRAANKANSVANAKAWRKAHHMLCVLAGTAPSKCKVRPTPLVKLPHLAPGVRWTRWPAQCRGSNAKPVKPTKPGKSKGKSPFKPTKPIKPTKPHMTGTVSRCFGNGKTTMCTRGFVSWGGYKYNGAPCKSVTCSTKLQPGKSKGKSKGKSPAGKSQGKSPGKSKGKQPNKPTQPIKPTKPIKTNLDKLMGKSKGKRPVVTPVKPTGKEVKPKATRPVATPVKPTGKYKGKLPMSFDLWYQSTLQ
jgi:hypothetical protein